MRVEVTVEDALSLRERLRRFLEVHSKAKILSADPGALRMYILHSKNSNTKPKDKIINFMLLRLEEILLANASPQPEEAVVSDFLLKELYKYYSDLKA